MAGTDNQQAESTDFIFTTRVGENLNLTEAIKAFEDRVGLAVENGVYLTTAKYPWNFKTEFENKPFSVATHYGEAIYQDLTGAQAGVKIQVWVSFE